METINKKAFDDTNTSEYSQASCNSDTLSRQYRDCLQAIQKLGMKGRKVGNSTTSNDSSKYEKRSLKTSRPKSHMRNSMMYINSNFTSQMSQDNPAYGLC